MDAVELIRLARPEVADATPQEAAAIKAGFERRASERGLIAWLRRLTRRQLIAGLIAIAIVPGSIAVATKLDGGDRPPGQYPHILELVDPQDPQQLQHLLDGCRELREQGVETDPCKALLEGDGRTPGGEDYVPDP